MSSTSARDPLVVISLVAGVGFTASAEYQLARTIGAPVPVAVLLPLALDVYVVAAIRRSRGRDIALSLVLMGVAQVAAHVLEANVATVSVPIVAAVSLLVPLVIWRVHALAVLPSRKTDTAAVPEPSEEAVPNEPEPEAVPVPESRPELTAVPEMKTSPVPVRRAARKTGTAQRKDRKKTATGTGSSSGTAAFEEHVRAARQLLNDDPEMTGTAIAKAIGTGDSYGRRVRRAALDAGTGTGRERPLTSVNGEGGYL